MKSNTNDLLRAVHDRMPGADGKMPTIKGVWQQYCSKNPKCNIKYSTLSGLVRQGYDGYDKPAPNMGAPRKVPDDVEAELAEQVHIFQLYVV